MIEQDLTIQVIVECLKYDIKDIPEDKLKEWENFWLEVAKQKNKVMEIKAWHGREKAMEEIIKSIKY